MTLPFNKGVNLLIGENNSGKTAIIDAIKLLLHTHSGEWIKIEHDDFNGTSDSLKIECRFEDLDENKAKNFVEWLSWSSEGATVKPYLNLYLDVTRVGDRILPCAKSCLFKTKWLERWPPQKEFQ